MALPTAPSLFGIASTNSILPGVFGHPASDTVHFEAVGSVAGVAATVAFIGSVSGVNWNNVTTLTFTAGTGNTAQFYASSAVKYNYYKCQVSGLSGGSISAWINS